MPPSGPGDDGGGGAAGALAEGRGSLASARGRSSSRRAERRRWRGVRAALWLIVGEGGCWRW